MLIFKNVLLFFHYRTQEILGNCHDFTFLQAAREESRKVSSLYPDVSIKKKKQRVKKQSPLLWFSVYEGSGRNTTHISQKQGAEKM